MNDFFNTNNETGEELKQSKINAWSQEEKIIAFFRACPTSVFSPSQIYKMINWTNNTPITSIRRAMSNLTHKGFLIKTTEQVRGLYGKKEFCWRLRR